jgi:drug/metabolite transporter superfamily protein YnfA
VYVSVALLWLWIVDGIRPIGWDLIGAAFAVLGMAISRYDRELCARAPLANPH